MPEHENSSDHERAFKEWELLEMTLNKGKTLDSKLQEKTVVERISNYYLLRELLWPLGFEFIYFI